MHSGSSGSAVDRLRDFVVGLRGDGRGWLLVALAVGWFFTSGFRYVVPALLPAIRADFPVSNATAGAAITLLWITYALTQFPAGALVDRVGERRLLVASAFLAAGGLLGYVLSVTFAVFLVATAAFGFGSGLYGPARGTVLTRAFPAREGAAFGVVLAAGSVGAALLPPAVTILATVVGWRLAIGVLIPGFLLVGVALRRVVPRGTASATDSTGSDPDPEGGVDPVPADGGSGDGTVEAGATDLPDGDRPGLRARAGPIVAAIATRQVGLAVLAMTVMLFAFQGLTAFYTTYLVEAKGLSEATAAALFGLMFVTGAITQSVGGGLADRHGYPRILAAISFLSVVPLALLPLLDGVVPLAVVSVFLGVRLSIGPVGNAYMVSVLPVTVRGTAWGLLRTAFFTVGAFGSTVVGAMADRYLFGEAFVLLAVLTGVGGVIYLFLPPR